MKVNVLLPVNTVLSHLALVHDALCDEVCRLGHEPAAGIFPRLHSIRAPEVPTVRVPRRVVLGHPEVVVQRGDEVRVSVHHAVAHLSSARAAAVTRS